jgi:hypothetical protein
VYLKSAFEMQSSSLKSLLFIFLMYYFKEKFRTGLIWCYKPIDYNKEVDLQSLFISSLIVKVKKEINVCAYTLAVEQKCIYCYQKCIIHRESTLCGHPNFNISLSKKILSQGFIIRMCSQRGYHVN